MNISIHTIKAASITALAALAFSAAANAADVKRSFSALPGDLVVVDVERAAISIRSWERSEIEFSAEQADDFAFEFTSEGGVVTIQGRHEDEDSWFGWFSSGPKAEISLSVPYRQDLNINTTGGDIQLDQLQGKFTAQCSGGNIEVGEVEGPIDAKTSGGVITVEQASDSVSARTSGGSIHLKAVAGEVTAKTSGGSIRIGEAGGATVAKTSGGSIEIEGAKSAVQARTSGGWISVGFAGQPESSSELRTSGGGVTAYLDDDLEVNLTASTSGGQVSSEFPQAIPENSAGSGRLSHAFNGGGPEIVLKTSGGFVRIRRLED